MATSESETRARASRSDLPASPLQISFVEFVCLIAALMAITALSIDIMLPALPQIAATFGVEKENDRQLVIILYLAGFSMGQIFFGPLSDNLGRKRVLMTGLAIFILGTIGAILAGSFEMLLLARVVQGLGAASPRIIAVAVVRDLYSGRQMARVMSFAMVVFIMIPVFAPSVGQAVVLFSSWQWIFFVLLVMAVSAAIWSGMRLPETARPALGVEKAMTLRASVLAAVSNGQTVGYGAAGGFMFGCLLAYVASAQQVFVGVFGLGDIFPVIFGALASAMALASFVNARLVGRFGMRRLSHAALFGFIGVSVLLATAAVLGLASFWVFAAAMGVAFFLFGLIAPNFNALAMEPQGHNAGMASSVVGSLSTAIGAIAGGVVAGSLDGSILPIAAGFAACSIIAGLIVFAIEGPKGLLGRNRPA
ncbi:multidrug effflux MFS transporter [Hyphomicrobium sp.]|uniref:multidrug effflux MFS transporter n=1 Tax=Hyphomicrobium sp. TaxID=82 RepID=UPI000F9E3310|nr:multidrug effflux MFS transporter [Hyphomicrobium sp.]RUP08491.1 MAG: Bcr/CflA family efflux MFS transporter [Hyphomicrobium sp.]